MDLTAMGHFFQKNIHRHKMGCAISKDSGTLVGGPLTTQNPLGGMGGMFPPRNNNGENMLTFKTCFLKKKKSSSKS